MKFGHLLLIALPLGHDGEKSGKTWSNGLRIFLLLYVLAMFVITAAYKGALLSSLAIPHIHTPIGEIVSQFDFFDIRNNPAPFCRYHKGASS